ncbi:MAG TPA: substrate-binding domain-containing protein [Pseudolysinimonas sp.]|jgi:ABC-type sugar transport system substrate-binding protein
MYISRKLKGVAVGAVLAIASLSLAACSSGSTGSGGSTSGDTSFLKTYQDRLAAAEKPVTWDGPTDTKSAPKNVFVGAVSCSYSVAGCKTGGETFDAVAKVLGWKSTNIVVNDPSGYPQAVETLLNEGVQAIYLGGVTTDVVANAMKEAKAKDIPVVSAISNYTTGGPSDITADTHPDPEKVGALMADAAIVEHKGKVDALFLQDAEFAAPVLVLKGAKKELDSCKECTITYASPLNFTASVIGTTLPNQVVSAVQRDPKINSLMLGFDPPATFIVPALATAGKADTVSMYSQLGNSAPLEFVKQGKILKVDVGASVAWATWADFDVIVRYLNKQELVDENIPLQLFTSSNPDAIDKLGKDNFSATFAGYEDKYKSLWGVN